MYESLLYLRDTYKLAHKTEVSEIGTDEYGTFIVLKETIFHPQGGGQPTDIGKINTENNESIFVHHVAFSTNKIKHYFDNDKDYKIKNGDIVELKVDKHTRINHARCHTAGHIIQAVVEANSKLKVVKGYHYFEGSYVEFHGGLDIPAEEMVIMLNTMIREIIPKDYIVQVNLVKCDEVNACYIDQDKDKKDNLVRIVKIPNLDENGVFCGGTHVTSTKEIGNVEVTKIKKKAGNIRMSYRVF